MMKTATPTALVVMIVVALVLAATGRASDRSQLARSATITRALGLPTVCVSNWRAYLRSIGIEQDAGWVTTTYTAWAYQIEKADVPDASCWTVLHPWMYEDPDVAIPLYYFAELAAVDDRECSIRRAFKRLRGVFGIRSSVTVSDFFPTRLRCQ